MQALLMLGGVFLLLTSYYLMKTAREGLILSGGAFGLRGDELKTYASGLMAVLLVGLVPIYGAIANRVRRIRLIDATCAFVLAGLATFFWLGRAGVPTIGVWYFVWLGMMSLFLVAQFWSYANDIYTEEQGKRLFGIVAVGGSLGAILGPQLAKVTDSLNLMPLAGVLLLAYLALVHAVDRREQRRSARHLARAPITGDGGFALVLRDRYLLLIAALLLVVNVVNTTGEYLLSHAVRERAMSIASGEAAQREVIKAFYGDFYFWVNALAFVVQAFLVSRVLDRLGLRTALFLMAFLVLGAYTAIAVAGGFAVIRAAKLTENGAGYSLQNTAHQSLFLTMSRPAKYKAKAAIDTIGVRAGDLCAAALVWIAVHHLDLGARALAAVDVALVVLLWIPACIGIARRHARLAEAT